MRRTIKTAVATTTATRAINIITAATASATSALPTEVILVAQPQKV